MRYFDLLGTAVVLAAAFCQGASGQAPQSKPALASDATPIPPRASAADYHGRAQAGDFTIAAEFTDHNVVTLQKTMTTDDYVAVEVAMFGPAGGRLKLSHEDFSLRINGNKNPLPAQSHLMMFSSLKDPEWSPPKSKEKDENGQPENSDRNPKYVAVPFEITRAMQVRVQKAVLPEGDRALPEAGLIFFRYGGRTNGIRTVELLYDGPAGKATLTLEP